MATSSSSRAVREPLRFASSAGAWFLATGFAFVGLGTIAIAAPVVAGLAVAVLVGWLLIAGGLMHGVKALRGEDVARAAWQAIAGLFDVIAGLYFLAHPLIALGTLTLVLAAVFLMEAVMDLMAWFATRDDAGSGWPLAEALVTGLLGVMIWQQWPSSSTWALGSLVGLNLMVDGVSQLMLGATWRRRFRWQRSLGC